jgi:hypothetical protein
MASAEGRCGDEALRKHIALTWDVFVIPMLIVFPVGFYGMWPLMFGKRGILRNWNAEDVG